MSTRPMSASRTRPTPAAFSPAPPRQPLVPFEEDGDEASVSDDVDIEEDDADDDEIDLDSYEAYLAEIQKCVHAISLPTASAKAAARPLSARALRPYPSESPAFYMVTTDNPVGPLGATSTPQPPPPNSNRPQRMPTRPASARSRLHSGEDAHQGASVSVPRAPLTARPTSASSSGQGRRKRQHPVTNDELSAHIRAAYSNVAPHARRGGRGGGGGAPLSSHTASSVVQRRLRVFQDADLQHEYHRLVDVVADLRTVVQHEQAQRTKAMARVRRLEEIVSLKDKKIDALLHGLGSSVGGDAAAASHQREMAQRERQHHALMQKLRQKLAQQTQLVASYEEATQALRTSVRSTRVLEMEHEIEQLQLEHGALHEALVAQSEELQYSSPRRKPWMCTSARSSREPTKSSSVATTSAINSSTRHCFCEPQSSSSNTRSESMIMQW